MEILLNQRGIKLFLFLKTFLSPLGYLYLKCSLLGQGSFKVANYFLPLQRLKYFSFSCQSMKDGQDSQIIDHHLDFHSHIDLYMPYQNQISHPPLNPCLSIVLSRHKSRSFVSIIPWSSVFIQKVPVILFLQLGLSFSKQTFQY